MQFEAKVTGLNETLKTMDRLPGVMRKKIYRKALLAGGAVVRDKAVQNVKAIVTGDDSSGVLAKSLRVYGLKKKRGWYRAGVMVKRGAVNPRKKDGSGKPVRVGLYASVLEYGKYHQPPRPWLKPAYQSEKYYAQDRVKQVISKNLLSAVNEAKNRK